MKLAIALLVTIVIGSARAQTILRPEVAIRAIYGDYDPATGTASGKLWHGNEVGVERISIDTLLSVMVDTGRRGPRTYVVTSAVPQQTNMGKYECHACAPEVGVGVFSFENGAWRVESKNDCADTIGASGHPPEADLIRIGENMYGIRLSVDDMHAGDETTSSEVVAPNGKSVSVIWKIMEYENNEGDYDPTGKDGSSDRIDFRSAYRFVPSTAGSDHYQIEVVSRGWGYGLNPSFRSQNWNATYRFKDGFYQLVKRTNFRESPTVKHSTKFSKAKPALTSLSSTQSPAPS